MDDGLSRLEPPGLDPDGQGWQQRKSIQTRVAILEAAVDCLERHGYARTTTQMIAQTAGISRGAMLHHYATKQDLISAVIDYTFYKRSEQFMARIGELSEEARVNEQAGIELYWQSVCSREFTAYLELSVASRTDEELRQVFLPKAHLFLRIERERSLAAFPEWADKLALHQLASDFTTAALEGLLLNREVWDDEERRQLLRGLIAQTVVALRDGKLPMPQGRKT